MSDPMNNKDDLEFVKSLIEACRDIAEKNPEKVYENPRPGETCAYVNPDGSPSCLIGHGLAQLGALDRVSPISNTDSIETLLGSWDMSCTKGQMLWLMTVQSAQDERALWGDAVESGDDTVAFASEGDLEEEITW